MTGPPAWETCWWPIKDSPAGICGRPAVMEVLCWDRGRRVAMHACRQHQAQAAKLEDATATTTVRLVIAPRGPLT